MGLWQYRPAPQSRRRRGGENEQITEETPSAQNPDHLYTSSKIAAELFCKNYKTLYDVNFTIMRYGIRLVKGQGPKQLHQYL
jgi:nucleoside-diphosphate-sugar epimerase